MVRLTGVNVIAIHWKSYFFLSDDITDDRHHAGYLARFFFNSFLEYAIPTRKADNNIFPLILYLIHNILDETVSTNLFNTLARIIYC